MKFNQLAVALIAYSGKIASVSAQDANGYTGSAYTLYAPAGTCKDGSSNNGGFGRHYNHIKMPSCLRFNSVDECATFCQSHANIDGHVGFVYWIDPNPDPTKPSDRCTCRYTICTGPSGPTQCPEPDKTNPAGGPWDELSFGAHWANDRGVGPIGDYRNSHDGTVDVNSRCYKRNCYGSSDPSCTGAARESLVAAIPTCSPTGAPTTSPTKSPTLSPSTTPTGSPTRPTTSPTASPSVSPTTGSPTTLSPTGSPSTKPTDSPTLSIASMYYPNWTVSNGGCKNGGDQPMYMTLAPQTWMFATLEDCCSRYFGWMLNECMGTDADAASGLWYPDWIGLDRKCKNDGKEPAYMAGNPSAWMHSSQLECCQANFGWTLNECLSSDPDAGATNKWYMKWDEYKCKQDCVGTGLSCGGRAASWDELFETRSACCADKGAWNPIDCPVD